MSAQKNISSEKQLRVIARVEPGSLGPDGLSHVEEFCRYANKNMSTSVQHYSRWQIIPRYDKTLPEMEYFVADKKLNTVQVEKYLAFFDNTSDAFEEEFYCKLTTLIEKFLAQEHA